MKPIRAFAAFLWVFSTTLSAVAGPECVNELQRKTQSLGAVSDQIQKQNGESCDEYFKKNNIPAEFRRPTEAKDVIREALDEQVGQVTGKNLLECSGAVLQSWKDQAVDIYETLKNNGAQKAALLKACDEDKTGECKKKLVERITKNKPKDDDPYLKLPAWDLTDRAARVEQADLSAKARETRLRMERIADQDESKLSAEDRKWKAEHGEKQRKAEKERAENLAKALQGVKGKLNDLGVKLQCYNNKKVRELLCYGAAYVIDPLAVAAPLKAAKAVRGVAGLIDKVDDVADATKTFVEPPKPKILEVVKPETPDIPVREIKPHTPSSLPKDLNTDLVRDDLIKNGFKTEGLEDAIKNGKPFELQPANPDSGPAQWLQNRQERFNARIIVDDTKFVGELSRANAFADGQNVYLRSSALGNINAQKDLVAHELVHAGNVARCAQFGGSHCSKTISFSSADGKSLFENSGYGKYYRTDEREAWLVQSKFDGKPQTAAVAGEFGRRQLEVLNQLKSDILSRKTLIPERIDQLSFSVRLGNGQVVSVGVPIRLTFASEEGARRYLLNVLEKRIRLLELGK